MKRNFEDAIIAGEQAISLDPNGADVTALLAMTLNWSGEPEKALALIEKAKRLSPLYSAWYLSVQAHALQLMDRHRDAIKIYEDSIARNPDHIGSRIGLAEIGQLEDARCHAEEIIRMNPEFTLSKYEASLTYRDPQHSERSLRALREAGLPD